ncbi:MAG: hypothetical protein R2909_15695 [Gemmatimonadales bacterium]
MSGTESPRWERVQALFLQAASLAEKDRAAFLARECGEDRELIDEVRALVVEDARAGSILDRGLGNVAGDLVGGEAGGPDLHFGPYRVLSRIGEGGMGVVYLAERPDPRTSRGDQGPARRRALARPTGAGPSSGRRPS